MGILLNLIRKPAVLVGLGGLGAVAFFWFQLQSERGSHADSRLELAAAQMAIADLRSLQATVAAERAQAVERALREQEAELENMRRAEASLRAALSSAQGEAREERTRAQAELGRLRRENQTLADWADTRVPDDIVSWLLDYHADDAPAAP